MFSVFVLLISAYDLLPKINTVGTLPVQWVHWTSPSRAFVDHLLLTQVSVFPISVQIDGLTIHRAFSTYVRLC